MRPRTLNHKILWIVLGLMVFSQLVFLYVTVQSFRTSYHAIVRDNLQTVGESLKEDLDFILGKRIPIKRLFGLEKLLKGLLNDAPTLQAVGIRGMDGGWLYYCDRDRFYKEDALSQPTDPESGAVLSAFSGLDAAYKLSFDLVGPGDAIEGTCTLAIDKTQIEKKSREILLDSTTIVVISILATIDFIFFIIAYTIGLPIFGAARDIEQSLKSGVPDYPVRRTGIDFIDTPLRRFERFRQRLHRLVLQMRAMQPSLGHAAGWRDQKISDVQENLARLKSGLDRFHPETVRPADNTVEGSPVLIRPVVFLFVFAEALANSFMPLYAEELYRPLWHLSPDVVLGLPISSFMLMSSLGLPFAGALSDTLGRRRSFIIGALVTCGGMILCGTTADILALVLYRGGVGLGFGITYISAQGYIIDTSSASGRAESMAIFLSALYGGSLCGTVIGALIAERIGFRSVFFLGAAMSLGSLVFLYLFIVQPAPAGPDSAQMKLSLFGLLRKTVGAFPSPRSAWRLFSDRNFSSLILLQAIPSKIVLIGVVFYTAPLLLKSLGNSQSDIGRYVIGYSLVMILLSQPISKWCDRKAVTKRFVLWGGIVSGAALIPFFWFSSTPVVVGSIVLIGLAHAFSVSNQDKLALHLKAAQAEGTGKSLGFYRQGERVGNVLAPIIMGLMIAGMGFARALSALGIYVIASGLLFGLLFREEHGSEN